MCWDDDEARARQTVHRLWPNEGLPGELAQILPTPEHFEQASQLVTEDMVAAGHTRADLMSSVMSRRSRRTSEAGFDELYVNQIGPGQDAFFEAYRDEVLPRLDR